jgi:molecular chaperone GrpE (heat shock protein)
VDEQLARLRAQVAGLEMDLGERDQRLEQMKAEYARLKEAREHAAGDAALEQLAKLFKKLAVPLANLAALGGLARAGREVDAGDLLQLLDSVVKELGRAGLESIGQVGSQVPFDSAIHQRMSGGTVSDGLAVTVCLPGYRFADRVLLKAMVSAREDRPAEEHYHEENSR